MHRNQPGRSWGQKHGIQPDRIDNPYSPLPALHNYYIFERQFDTCLGHKSRFLSIAVQQGKPFFREVHSQGNPGQTGSTGNINNRVAIYHGCDGKRIHEVVTYHLFQVTDSCQVKSPVPPGKTEEIGLVCFNLHGGRIKGKQTQPLSDKPL